MKSHPRAQPSTLSFQTENSTVTKPGSVSRLRKALRLIAALMLLLTIWVAVDLLAPRSVRLRQFDADEVARLDTAMWRSYYNRQRFLLFRQLAELLRTQYRMPFFRSNVTAFRAASAAFIFKEGKGRSDYEKALPDLAKFYAAIREMGDIPFDVQRVAKLELKWWIVHRERQHHAPDDLERALAEAAAGVYQVPAASLTEYAQLRAEAMRIRDDRAEAGTLSEADWQRIDALLHASWQSLHQAVNH